VTRTSTTALFRSALDLVRAAPLDDRSRPPAFALPHGRVAARPTGGAINGLPGDLWDVAERIRSGEYRGEDILRESRSRIALYAERYRAFDYVAEESFLPSPGNRSLPFYGIPVTVKDVIHVAGMPTQGSSQAMRPILARKDSTAVARLRAAGASIIGKVATHEFALGVTTPQSYSPWDERRVPGGSSGGSAISIVTGMALASIGTDTRASIRVPAALNGLVGFKSSYGTVPVDEWLTLSWTLDHIAPMARSVRDVALLMDTIAGPMNAWTGALPGRIEGLRVGVAEAFVAGCEPGVRASFEAALAAAETAGATVVPVTGLSDEDLALANAVGMIVSRAEATQFHQEMQTDLDRCIPEVRDQLKEARSVLATDYVRAMRLRGQLRERFAAAFERIDVLAMPTSKVVAPLREDADQYLLVLSENCIPWSLVDFPAISVFSGLSDGLPVGLQLVGPPGHDLPLLAAAHAFERVLPRPPEWRPQ
jgi:Asp-tRNA(Asn)/Glu-tRNA(Gln) amidotransferase A subunit family amidase